MSEYSVSFNRVPTGPRSCILRKAWGVALAVKQTSGLNVRQELLDLVLGRIRHEHLELLAGRKPISHILVNGCKLGLA